MSAIQHFDPVAVAQVPEGETSSKRFILFSALCVVVVVMFVGLFKVDVITRFDGEIAARSGTVKIISLEQGVVASTHVANGALVRKGDRILSLDDTALRTQQQIYLVERRELEQRLSDVLSMEKSISALPLPLTEVATLDVIHGAYRSVVDASNNRSLNEFRDKVSSLYEASQRLRSEHEERKKDLERIKKLEAIRYKRFSMLREAAVLAAITKLELLDAEEKLVDFQQQAMVAAVRLETAERAKNEQHAKFVLFVSESLKSWRDAIADYRSRIAILQQRIESSRYAMDQLEIRSPLDGVVQDIQVRHVGVRIPQGAAVASVVPVGDPIVVEGWIDNQDVAYVRNGQQARIKVEAYPYTLYGSLSGHVSFVAQDSNGINQGRQYKVQVNLDTQHSGRMRKLSLVPGMKVSMEVVTDERRFIGYFYTSAVQAVDGAFSER